ncbi:MAG: glycosyl transferase family 2 [Kiritimatiellaeota bacterium]|nr:glycosyl transferase family 2 [Kiritimatiellota bacterium]
MNNSATNLAQRPLPPRISIIIPSRPEESVTAALAGIRNSAYPPERLELWHTVGNQPSGQRNRCAVQAQGDLLYFLDSDTLLPPGGHAGRDADPLALMAQLFQAHPRAIVGGPSLTPPGDQPFQQGVGLVLGSRFGGGAVRARYARVGATRATDQHEIILCNMMMDRASFRQLQGFNEHLYPNEENDLICRMQSAGGEVIYVPAAGIYRSQRSSLRKFMKQIYTYGRGRAAQTLLSPRSFSLMVLPAVLFTLYWILLGPFCLWLWPSLAARLSVPDGLRRLLPLAPGLFYVALNLGFSVFESLRAKRPGQATWLPLLFFLHHFLYGAGFLAGLGLRRRGFHDPGAAACTVRLVKPFGAGW